jgi:DNA end-binding protein Ku
VPQTVWKGAISFGLVSIPVRLAAATEERDLSFHQVRASDGSRVRYRRVAEADGEEVAYRDIAKSYRTDSGVDVILTDEDLAAVRIPSSRTVELVGFVDAATIDPLTLTRAYFVEPAADDRKPYVLLRDALVDTERVAVVKLALRNRERLAVLRPREEILVLQTMLWPDEVRRPDIDVGDGSGVRPQELAMARSYIDALSGDLDLSDQHDGYRAALLELVDAKAAGQAPPEPAEDTDAGGADVVDLVEALRRSVAAATGRAPAVPATEKQSKPESTTAARSRRTAAPGSGSAPTKATARKPATSRATTAKAAPKAARKTAEKTAEAKRPVRKSA